MIKKVLIANRGEIALRIIRTLKEMGIESVAIYSSGDAQCLHTQLATQKVCIGGPQAKDSYLNMDAIVEAALKLGCDAIHPGFGFLSENAQFAKLVESCGLIFIGPTSKVIQKLGNKSEARKIMQQAKVPIIPGTKEIITKDTDALAIARDLGYPIIIKAVNGGGGRGMRIVACEEEFESLHQQAKKEAMACFGDDDVYMEKYIENPKHIEVQVVGDEFGHVIHLFERDCSLQRRNQKMLEEAPCYSLSEELRSKMCNDAIKACKSVGYTSAGTIEFLLDKNGQYYFMEMNTRIQVEHPITEMITGVDIVKLQLQVANHQALPYKQQDIACKGYALECRINAEDMKRDFAPSPGTIHFLHTPGGGGIRVDSGVYSGYCIPPYYDSMLMKIISFAPTRLQCIKKMRVALEELMIEGVETNIEFQYLMLHRKEFIAGSYDTSFCESFIKELKENGEFIS